MAKKEVDKKIVFVQASDDVKKRDVYAQIIDNKIELHSIDVERYCCVCVDDNDNDKRRTSFDDDTLRKTIDDFLEHYMDENHSEASETNLENMEQKTTSRDNYTSNSMKSSVCDRDMAAKRRMSFELANNDLKSVSSRHTIESTIIVTNRHNHELQASQWCVNDRLPWYRRIKLWFNRLFRRW